MKIPPQKINTSFDSVYGKIKYYIYYYVLRTCQSSNLVSLIYEFLSDMPLPSRTAFVSGHLVFCSMYLYLENIS